MVYPSLETKFILIITLTALLFSFLAIAGQYYVEYQYEMHNIEQNLFSIETSYLTAITASRFFLDDDQLGILLRGIYSRPNINFVAVLEERNNFRSAVAAMGTYTGRNSLERTFPLVYTYKDEERTLGVLFVEAGLSHLHAKLRNQVFLNIVGIIFITLFFAASIILFQQRFILRHLKKINLYLKSVRLTSSSYIALSLDREHFFFKHPDELDTITRTINRMLSRISSSYKKEQESREQLSSALQERETLVRELYHRTRNTMQVILSMLVIEASRMEESPATRILIKETERRIFSVSLVHELLYRSQDLSHIDSTVFVEELVRYMMNDVSADTGTDLQTQSFPLILDTAIPLGLILIELLSLSLRYRRTREDGHTIHIELSLDENNYGFLYFQDKEVNMKNIRSESENQAVTAITLIQAISKQQMNSKGDFSSNDELEWHMQFPLSLYSVRVTE